jgi:RimJ/RimL family protein N-acetyltransferase
LADAEVLPSLCNDPDIARFLPLMPSPYTAEDARWWVTEGSAWSGSGVALAIVDAKTQDLLGGTGLSSVHAPRSQAEVGYWVAKRARGQGVARAAVNALSDWAYQQGLYRLELLVAKDNPASQRVALACGFKREGVRANASPDREGGRRDLVAFARLRDSPPGPVPRLLPDFPGRQLTDGVVRVRPLRPDDVDNYLALYELPEVAESTIGGKMTYTDAVRKCATAESAWLSGEVAECVIEDAVTGAFAGDIALRYWQPMLSEALLGYSLRPEFRGRGFMTRAVELLSDWAFSQTGVIRVKAGTFRGNEASQRVLTRAGFTWEADARAFLPGPEGTRIDDIQYVRVSPDYQARLSKP